MSIRVRLTLKRLNIGQRIGNFNAQFSQKVAELLRCEIAVCLLFLVNANSKFKVAQKITSQAKDYNTPH